MLFSRYDVFPALATFLAVESARRDRWRRAWGWAVVGGLLKLFPLVLLPGFLLAEHARTGRWPLRRVGAACVPFALVAGVQSVLSPGSALSPLVYEAKRGFGLEGLAGSLTLIVDPFHIKWRFNYGNWEIVGAYHNVISVLVTVAMVGGLIAIWRLAAQGRLSVEACSLAILSVAILGDKAFSPQYLIWLVPLWAYWPMRRGWLVAAALTTLVFPFLFMVQAKLTPYGFYPAAIGAVARNLVLIVATARWFREQVRAGDVVAAPLRRRYPALDRVRAAAGTVGARLRRGTPVGNSPGKPALRAGAALWRPGLRSITVSHSTAGPAATDPRSELQAADQAI